MMGTLSGQSQLAVADVELIKTLQKYRFENSCHRHQMKQASVRWQVERGWLEGKLQR
jgi:hypothetical protein